MSGAGITIVGASAGSGKTYRLTEDVTQAVSRNGDYKVPLEGLFAVTYTKKAHTELTARIRHKLVEENAFTEALRLPLAYLGTVHSACLRLLQEFALDAGLSPTVDVVAEDQAKLLRQALESALTEEQRANIDCLAARFKLRYDDRKSRYEWLRPVGDIMDLARGNRIHADKLAAMAARSAESLLKLLPTPAKDGSAIDAALARELSVAAKALRQYDDGTKATKGVIELVDNAVKRLADKELDWCDWVKLSTLAPGKKSLPAVEALRTIAAQYEVHPTFRAELTELTAAIYGAAEIGLSAYQAWKTDRRVVDYVDMLDGALDLVSHPRVRAELSERLKFAVVDEFQDTSPIQLALFVEIHKLAKRSVWVGDRKQCIFEYAGADPMLMDSVAEWVGRSGGKRDTLDVNRRSRPELVHACSELFARALDRHGFGRAEVVVKPHRKTPKGLDALPPFGLWCLETGNKEEDAQAIAEGVRRMLAKPAATPVVDRVTDEVREVRPGDIAILVATNAEARAIADALHGRGLRCAIARAGLLKTPEGALADAALRWLLDADDSLAAATIDAITGFDGRDGDTWLAAKLANASPAAWWHEPLAAVRPRLAILSPVEALDEALASLDAVHLCARWPDPKQRVANLDALRALSTGYEDRCSQEREGATVAGLLRYLDDMGTETLRRDEMLASDDQHVPTDDGAVIVCTYHKAKGLEWPVVVLGSLDREERRDAFEVSPESDGSAFDPIEPLAGRWIRYWPWPFGSTKKVPLADAAEASPEGKRVAMREDKERARLLYVGFTRARDHLVLAVRMGGKGPKTGWLDALRTADGGPLLGLAAGAADGVTDVTRIAEVSVPTRVFRLTAEAAMSPAAAAATETHRWFARGAPARVGVVGVVGVVGAGYRIAPSNAQADWPELALPTLTTLGEVVSLGGALPLDGKVAAYDRFGDAVHAFLAADLEGLSAEERLERARRLVSAAGFTGIVRPDALVTAGDRLRGFVHARWPGAKWRRECPIDALIDTPAGKRRVNGTIDLLLETSAGCVVIDHKTFPGATEAAWRMKASEFVHQLAAYGAALGEGRKMQSAWIHFPIGGGCVEAAAVHHR